MRCSAQILAGRAAGSGDWKRAAALLTHRPRAEIGVGQKSVSAEIGVGSFFRAEIGVGQKSVSVRMP
jgi:hypothetical protein